MVEVNWHGREQKWAYLESLTTTTMTIHLLPTLGKPTMKYIEMYV